MPRSVVIYTSKEAFPTLEDALLTVFEGSPPSPYTLSFPQKAESGAFRVRITELGEGAVGPIIAKIAESRKVILASASDRDVKATTYEELMEDANRFSRIASLQFSSPTILDIDVQHIPFPVVPFIFRQYTSVWNSFSSVKMAEGPEWVRHVQVVDFKISCASTPFGLGFEGWILLEMDKGRTEEEIARFNTLADFAFYAGTGLYTVKGLGQTRRVEAKRQR